MANRQMNDNRQPQQQAGGRQMQEKQDKGSRQAGSGAKQKDQNQQRRDRH
jgi:hypothetical protein